MKCPKCKRVCDCPLADSADAEGVSDSEPPGLEGTDESRDNASPASADAPEGPAEETYAALRQGLRTALWRDDFWPNNPGVGDNEIIEAVGRLMDERALNRLDAQQTEG